MAEFKRLNGYSSEIINFARQLVADNELGPYLLKKYPVAHDIMTDSALYDYALRLKAGFLRDAPSVNKVAYDENLEQRTLAIFAPIQREIKVDAVFKHAPLEFLRMLLLHELAHLKEPAHDEAFYRLHGSMIPDYVQLHLDINLYLTYLDLGGEELYK